MQILEGKALPHSLSIEEQLAERDGLDEVAGI